jgi:RNA recognition motif-containing protein
MTQLFIGNIEFSTSQQELQQLIESVGDCVINGVKLLFTPGGKPRGCGFVYLYDEDDARKIIALLNNYTWRGRALRIEKARPTR